MDPINVCSDQLGKQGITRIRDYTQETVTEIYLPSDLLGYIESSQVERIENF